MENISKHPFFRRRHYLINQDFQFRYIGLLIGLACTCSLIFILAAKYYITINLDPIIESGLISSPAIQELISMEKNFLNKNLLTIFLLLIATLTLSGILITHRIAGPIYALERRMKQIAHEGIQSTEFRIRRSDEFQELAESFNDMILSLQKHMNQNNEKLQKIEELLTSTIQELEQSSIERKKLNTLYQIRNLISQDVVQKELKKAA